MMPAKKTLRHVAWFVLALPILWLGPRMVPADEDPPAGGKYIGSAKCENCHDSAAKGKQYSRWKEEKHSKAYEVLASDEAKRIGREKGIDDPQTSDACLKCHVTGHGASAKSKAKSFDPTEGVGCEACHGSGQNHMKARLLEEGGDDLVEIPDDEIVKDPGEEACVRCHNSDSPTFKPFDFAARVKDVAHPDPRK